MVTIADLRSSLAGAAVFAAGLTAGSRRPSGIVLGWISSAPMNVSGTVRMGNAELRGVGGVADRDLSPAPVVHGMRRYTASPSRDKSLGSSSVQQAPPHSRPAWLPNRMTRRRCTGSCRHDAAAKGRCVVVQLSCYPSSAERQSVVGNRDDLERPGHSRTQSRRRARRLALALYKDVRDRVVPDQPIGWAEYPRRTEVMYMVVRIMAGSTARTSLSAHSVHRSAASRCQSASRFPEHGCRSRNIFRS